VIAWFCAKIRSAMRTREAAATRTSSRVPRLGMMIADAIPRITTTIRISTRVKPPRTGAGRGLGRSRCMNMAISLKP
jgi:hypothetical protein